MDTFHYFLKRPLKIEFIDLCMCSHSTFPSHGVPVPYAPRGWLKMQPNRKWVLCAIPHLRTATEAQAALGIPCLGTCSGPSITMGSDYVSKANGSLMWWGTRGNIWKTPMYLNRSKWVFCSSCPAGLPVTSPCLEEGRESCLQALIQVEKKCALLLF